MRINNIPQALGDKKKTYEIAASELEQLSRSKTCKTAS